MDGHWIERFGVEMVAGNERIPSGSDPCHRYCISSRYRRKTGIDIVASAAFLLLCLTIGCTHPAPVAAGDLEILNFECPKQVLPGQDVGGDVNINVRNRSDRRIYEDVEVLLLLSRDRRLSTRAPSPSSSFREDAVLPGGRGKIYLVAGNNRWSRMKSVRLPKDTKPGKYFFVALARTTNPRKRRSAGTAIAFRAVWVRNPLNPDLVVSVRGPRKAFAGEAIGSRVNVRVTNQGRRRAGPFAVELRLSRDGKIPPGPASESAVFREDARLPGGLARLPGLGPGASARVRFPSLRTPGKTKRGNYRLFAVVDPFNEVSEKDELNNDSHTPVRLIPVHRAPDIVGRLRLEGRNVIRPGEALARRLVAEVRNVGTRPVEGEFSVQLLLSSDVRLPLEGGRYTAGLTEDCILRGGRATVRGLAVGQRKRIRFKGLCQVPRTKRTGEFILGLVIDPRNRVREISEKNNTAIFKTRIH